MLDLTSLLISWPAPCLIGIVITFVQQVDSSNDRAIRPIPVAHNMWRLSLPSSSACP